MVIFNKTFNPSDYSFLQQEISIYKNMERALDGVRHEEHEHRAWEYGLGLNLIRTKNLKRVLDVGGGGSIFAMCCASLNCTVAVIDSNDISSKIQAQNQRLHGKIEPVNFIHKDFFTYDTTEKFDLVTCISVIEHVPDDLQFFERLTYFVKENGYLLLTFDYHASGSAIIPSGQIRTYNLERVERLQALAKEKGFELLGPSDYTYDGNHVNNGYNFGSFALYRSRAVATVIKTNSPLGIRGNMISENTSTSNIPQIEIAEPLDWRLVELLRKIVPTLEGWCSNEKAVTMASLIVQMRPRVSVEIGVFGGRSLLAQAVAHRHIGSGHVYGIDPWDRDAALTGIVEPQHKEWWSKLDYEEIYRGCLDGILKYDLCAQCTVLRTTSSRAAAIFDTIDVLHIDGNHSEVTSTADVKSYIPKVRPNGFVWLDGTDWASTAKAQLLLGETCDKISAVGGCGLYQKRI